MDDFDTAGPDCGPVVTDFAHAGGVAGTWVGAAAGLGEAIEEGPAAPIAGANTIAGTAAIGNVAGQVAGAGVGFLGCEGAYLVEQGVEHIGDLYHGVFSPAPTEPAPAPASPILNPDLASTNSNGGGGWGGFHSMFEGSPVAWGTDLGGSSPQHDTASPSTHHDSVPGMGSDI